LTLHRIQTSGGRETTSSSDILRQSSDSHTGETAQCRSLHSTTVLYRAKLIICLFSALKWLCYRLAT